MSRLDDYFNSFLGINQDKEEKEKIEEPIDAQVIPDEKEPKKTVRRGRGKGKTKEKTKATKKKGKAIKFSGLDDEDEDLWEKWTQPDENGRISNMERGKSEEGDDE